MRLWAAATALTLLTLSAHAQGMEGEAALCRPGAVHPALMIEIVGLKDRAGLLRVELYPDSDPDFLSDSNKLLADGKTFRRLVFPVPSIGHPVACLGAPAPGRYSLVIVHNRDGKPKFSALKDGIGFPGDPKLSYSQPPARKAWITVGDGVTRLRVRLQYLHGFFTVGPIHDPVDDERP